MDETDIWSTREDIRTFEMSAHDSDLGMSFGMCYIISSSEVNQENASGRSKLLRVDGESFLEISSNLPTWLLVFTC